MDIERGMTPEQVAELIGPPLDRIDMAGVIGGSQFAIVTTSERGWKRWFRRRKPQDPTSAMLSTFFWYYPDWPDKGTETMVNFAGGMVSSVQQRPSDPLDQAAVQHEWARDLITRQVARVATNHPDDRLVARPGWQRLTSPEVLDFVLNVNAFPARGERVPGRARRFGDLDLLVTMLPVIDSHRIRQLMPDGYLPVLDTLLRSFGLRPGRNDIAHWILCRDENDGGTVAHLCYVPSTREVTALMPWNLLSAEEQSRGTKTG